MQVEFINTRFDPDLTPFHAIAKQMAQAVGYTAKLDIDEQLAQLLRLRVAQANGCAYCVILHTKAARNIGIIDAKVDGISAWRHSDLYDKKEKAALAYCDALNDGKVEDFERYHQALEAFFDPKQIAQIAAIVINMNVWTRLKLAQGATPVLTDGGEV